MNVVVSTANPAEGINQSADVPIDVLGLLSLPYNPPTTNLTKEAPYSYKCPHEYLITGLLAGIVSIAGIIGNLLSLFTFRRERGHATVFLLKSLAVADSCFLTTHLLLKSVPSTFDLSSRAQTVFTYLVYVFYPGLSASYTIGIWVTTILAVYRFLAVSYPMKAALQATLPRARGAVLVIVLTALVLELPRYFEMRIVRSSGPARIAPSDLWHERLYQLLYRTLVMSGARVLLPCVLVVLLTARLVLSLAGSRKERARLIHITTTKGANDFRASGEQALAASSVAVILVFILCTGPTFAYPLVRIFVDVDPARCDPAYAYTVILSEFLLVVNATVNFVIYFLMRATFRRNLRRALSCNVKVKVKVSRVKVSPADRGHDRGHRQEEGSRVSWCGDSGPTSITSENQVEARF